MLVCFDANCQTCAALYRLNSVLYRLVKHIDDIDVLIYFTRQSGNMDFVFVVGIVSCGLEKRIYFKVFRILIGFQREKSSLPLFLSFSRECVNERASAKKKMCDFLKRKFLRS